MKTKMMRIKRQEWNEKTSEWEVVYIETDIKLYWSNSLQGWVTIPGDES